MTLAGTDKAQERDEAREYWATHSIADEQGEEVEVRKPLSVMLSLRLDKEHLEKLKVLARAQSVGMTTMARLLLRQALDQPANQLFFQAMEQTSVREAVPQMAHGPQNPSGNGEAAYFVLSMAELDQVSRLVQQTSERLLFEGLKARCATVTPERPELFDKLRELAAQR